MFKKIVEKKKIIINLIFILIILIFINIKYVIATTTNFSSNQIEGVSVAPLSGNTFVIGYCDQTDVDISFAVYNTTGSVITSETDVDTDVNANACEDNPVSVSALNETDFVIGWFDYTDQDITFAVYTEYGQTLKTGPIDADTNAGGSLSVSVSALNETDFVIGWKDNTDQDATFNVYNVAGTNNTGPTDADTNAGFSDGISVSALNETDFVIGWYDSTDLDITFNVYNILGINRTGPTDVDIDVAYNTRSVSVSTLNETDFIIGWYDSTDYDITFSIYSNYGQTLKTGPIDADTNAGAAFGFTTVSTLNETDFVIGWYDTSETDATFNIYNVAGTNKTGPIDVSTTILSSYQTIGLTSRETASNIEICNDNFVIAYVVSATNASFSTYYSNGTLWDGYCDITPPNIILSRPANIIFTNNPITFEVNLTDASNLHNISLIGNWSGSWDINETSTINGTSNSSNWNIRIPVGKYLWSAYACDQYTNCGYATINRTLQFGNITKSFMVYNKINEDDVYFIINTLGNTGIGTNNPTSKLTINGDLRIENSGYNRTFSINNAGNLIIT